MTQIQKPNGKVVLITGANTGIGRITAIKLAMQGYHVFLACRDFAKTQAVLNEINSKSQGAAQAEFLPLDLGDLDSVNACADAFLAKGLPLHVLINNAGLAGVKGFTKSGFELAFGVCHVGHFLLTQRLLPLLQQSAPSRIVNVSSRAHLRTKGIDFDAVQKPTSSPTAVPEYCVAKLANLLFTKELARRLKGTGVNAYALHPGVVATEVWRALPGFVRSVVNLFMMSPEEGAATTLHCATAQMAEQDNGQYFVKCKQAKYSPYGDDLELANTLWVKSEQWVKTNGHQNENL